MSTRHLYLVRHSLTDYDEPADELGPGLNPIGLRQAHLVADHLRQTPLTTIHHSPLRRAAQTAAVIGAACPGVPLRASPLLAECVPGYPAEFATHFAHLAPGRVERDRQQVDAAFGAFIVSATDGDIHEAIVCHGNIIRALMMQVLRVPTERWVHAVAYNCGLSHIMVDGAGQPFLLSFNETGHLPIDLRTH